MGHNIPGLRVQMSLLLAYRAFRADLMGWMKMDFPTFRDVYDPLRRRRVWAESDQKILRDAADMGAAYALRRLYSKSATTKAQIEKLLGSRGLEPEYLTKDELDQQMKALISDCLRDEWTPQTFTSFGAYLDSDKGPDDLDKTAAKSASTMFSMGVEGAPPFSATRSTDDAAPGSTDAKKPSTPTTDLFAEKYRSASAPFRAAVQEHLKEGARRATQKAKAALSELIGTAAVDIGPPDTGAESDLVASLVRLGGKKPPSDSSTG